MAETYFDYIMTQCRCQGIKGICDVYPTRRKLMEDAKEEVLGCRNVVSDAKLLRAVKKYLPNGGYVSVAEPNRDFLELYSRTEKTIYNTNIIYPDLFSTLVDVCWLFSSMASVNNERKDTTELLISPTQIKDNIRSYLTFLYSSAAADYKEICCIQEAMDARHKHPILTGLYPFQYSGSQKYLSTDITISDLENYQGEINYQCNLKVSMFFGLTATVALAEEIRRFA